MLLKMIIIKLDFNVCECVCLREFYVHYVRRSPQRPEKDFRAPRIEFLGEVVALSRHSAGSSPDSLQDGLVTLAIKPAPALELDLTIPPLSATPFPDSNTPIHW